MKTLKDLIGKNEYISLENFSSSVKEKLESIDNKQINECCCDCGCDCKCCCDVPQSFIFFYSENEIVNKLKTDVKVQDLFNLHNQFGNKFRFKSEEPSDVKEPLYFTSGEKIPYQTQNKLQEVKSIQFNKKVYDFIKSLTEKYNFTYPVALSENDNNIQLFFIKGTGSNGKECSIKKSLLEIYELLCELEKDKKIKWSQVLNISIDNMDDVYTFVITCILDSEYFNEYIKIDNHIGEIDKNTEED